MFRTYDWTPNLGSFAKMQWPNYQDWNDEMGDIASCAACFQPDGINDFLHSGGVANASGWGSDLLAVQTHGSNNNSFDSSYEGRVCGKANQNKAFSRQMHPDAASFGNTEIGLFWACSFFTANNFTQWHGFRNMHRKGMHIATGCFGTTGLDTCFLVNTGVNTTWNEIGDEIADGESKIWDAWLEGHAVGIDDDDIVVFGIGKKTAADCDNRANGVTFQNRNNFADYTYAVDLPDTGDYELCGFMAVNW